MSALIGFDKETGALKLAVESTDLKYLQDKRASSPHLVLFELEKLPEYPGLFKVDTDAGQMIKVADYDDQVQAIKDARADEDAKQRDDQSKAALEKAEAEFDNQAEAARLKYLTKGDGQAMSYIRKATQARLYLAESAPDETLYPWLTKEAPKHGMDVAEFARFVLAAEAEFDQVGSDIEAARIGAKKAARSAWKVGDDSGFWEALAVEWGAVIAPETTE